ncbi:MAG: serine hydrolase [Candidatus Microbacterium phytovorans]|uniref:Serine hydrolase n=1 Tax=Candidatus Microbacterium phytovorans TaxID=3121374 RepID=A0AAJ5W164_9MICO|nr:serine hydrolase [Microbacterium sp.]WEK12973.1 MAG: serine hydrolase [Microbacterium sp.]
MRKRARTRAATGSKYERQNALSARGVLSRQVSAQRIPSGFPPEVAVAGKTGTLEGIRNEASVVTYPDGRSIAIAVFTRSLDIRARNPEADRALGEVARLAAEAIRLS